MSKFVITAAMSLLLSAGASFAQTEAAKTAVDPNIFPAAKAGYTRHILNIPATESENAMQIEIVAGLTMEVDCNHVMISADIDDETLNGWGYNYYEIDDVSKPASTLKGCPDNSKKQEFVTLNMGRDAIVRYNSKLPLVVYAPENLEVGYRIWQTDSKIHKGGK